MTAPVQGSKPTPRVVASRYRLDRLIGRGAMGAVWRAEDSVLGRPVAVKEVLLPPGLSPQERAVACERMLREARAIAKLPHPNVVTLFDVLDEDGRPWVVMELVPARSLAHVVREDGPLPAPEVAAIGLAVLSALEAAHAAGITHRDVKPGNILIAEDGRVKLTDFGIARSVEDAALTSAGLLLGSPSYIAPEVIRGQPAGPAADLFGLGATMYAAVEGQPPFHGDDAIATLNAVVSNPPEPYQLAGPLALTLSGLLRKDPHARLSPMAIRRQLQDIQGSAGSAIQGGPLPAGPPPYVPPGPPPRQPAAGWSPTSPLSQPPAAPPIPTSTLPGPGYGYPSTGRHERHRTRRPGWVLAGVAALCAAVLVGAVLLANGVFGSSGAAPTRSAGPGGSAATGPAPVPAGYVTFTDPAGHYTVGVPQDWQPVPYRSGIIDVRNPADRDQFLRFIARHNNTPALAELTSEEPGFASRYPTYHKIGLGSVDYRGYDAADWEFTFIRGGITKHVLYRLFTVHGWLYGLYLSAPDDAFGGLRQHFDTAAATFAPTS